MSYLLYLLLTLSATRLTVSSDSKRTQDENVEIAQDVKSADQYNDNWFHDALLKSHRNHHHAKHHENDAQTIDYPVEDAEKKRTRRRHVHRRQVQQSALPDEVLDIFNMGPQPHKSDTSNKNGNKHRRQTSFYPNAATYYHNTVVPNGHQYNTFNTFGGFGPFQPYPMSFLPNFNLNNNPFRFCYYIVVVPYVGNVPPATTGQNGTTIDTRFYYPDQFVQGENGLEFATMRPSYRPQPPQPSRPATMRPPPRVTTTTTTVRPYVEAEDVDDSYYDDFGTDTGISLQPVRPPGTINRPVPPLLHGSSATSQDLQGAPSDIVTRTADYNSINSKPASTACSVAVRNCCRLNQSQWNQCFKNNRCESVNWSPHPCLSYKRLGQ